MINCNLHNWFYNHTNLTGLEKVNGEHSLIMLVYNIKRSINMLGVSDLIAKLKKWNSPYKAKACLVYIMNYFRLYKDRIKKERQFVA
jgi:propanediol dehydratase small subunit